MLILVAHEGMRGEVSEGDGEASPNTKSFTEFILSLEGFRTPCRKVQASLPSS
ncbi:hypothetical protein MNBD_NITROSPINAE04-2236 [hydrothermal vent metagenome]|uniref:Uncharacterized protein n=1 Tax=hydrothermal vent metagenome TaxID=652676 RepID=A0A3B1C2W3_9ZZZZ